MTDAAASRKKEENAEMILTYSRRVLAGQLPELMPAFFLLKWEPAAQAGSLWTDGVKLYYHAETVIRDYVQDEWTICMQLLHIVLHGLQGHFSKRKEWDACLFDAVADARTTDLMRRLGYHRPLSSKAERLVENISGTSLEAACAAPIREGRLKKLCDAAQALRSDDHRGWPSRSADGGDAVSADEFCSDQWNKAAEQCTRRLGSSKRWGDLPDSFCELYRGLEPSGVSYREFLRSFLKTEETVGIDPDSIDRTWYHIGLEHFGDIPIIEPDELREDIGRLSVVVALDTSGSCCGDLFKKFLEELLSVLRSFSDFCVTLIQCDAQVHRVERLTSEDGVEDLLDSFTMCGGGGTDFRPVFQYLEKACENGDEPQVNGLLYFSDGCGTFPKKAPEYPVAVLIPQEELCYGVPELPDWVTLVTIMEDDTLRIG